MPTTIKNKTTRANLIRQVKAGLTKYFGSTPLVLAGTSYKAGGSADVSAGRRRPERRVDSSQGQLAQHGEDREVHGLRDQPRAPSHSGPGSGAAWRRTGCRYGARRLRVRASEEARTDRRAEDGCAGPEQGDTRSPRHQGAEGEGEDQGSRDSRGQRRALAGGRHDACPRGCTCARTGWQQQLAEHQLVERVSERRDDQPVARVTSFSEGAPGASAGGGPFCPPRATAPASRPTSCSS